ncbi:MAG: hypothetical protein AB2A00_09480 [Myxococcota bacterium]
MAEGSMLSVWVVRINALHASGLAPQQLAQDLHRLDASTAVSLLAQAHEQVGTGSAEASRFMLAVHDMLAEELIPYERLTELYTAAAQAGLVAVQRLLLAPPPRQERRAPQPRRAPEGSDTLGMRTWLARCGEHHHLDKLSRDPDPRVIRNLLLNPRLTEKDVLKIVTRRPALADVLREVARNDKWTRRAAVRRALVFNPFTPTEVALRLLPFMSRADLHALAVDGKVHAEVAQQAVAFARKRPPAKEPPSARGRSHTRVEGAAANDDLEQDPPTYREPE